MLTAAHVVGWGGDRHWFEDAHLSSTYELMAGYENGTAYSTQTKTNADAIFFAGYDPNSPSQQPTLDLALVKLSTPFAPSSGEAIAFFLNKPWTSHANVSITGYSGDGETQNQVTTSININASANGELIFTSVGPGSGASGGPVMAAVGPDGELAVIGTYNRAPVDPPAAGLYLKVLIS